MKYEGLWAHFWAPLGFAALLRRYLAEAQAALHCRRRAERVTCKTWSARARVESEGVQVEDRGKCAGAGGQRAQKSRDFVDHSRNVILFCSEDHAGLCLGGYQDPSRNTRYQSPHLQHMFTTFVFLPISFTSTTGVPEDVIKH